MGRRSKLVTSVGDKTALSSAGVTEMAHHRPAYSSLLDNFAPLGLFILILCSLVFSPRSLAVFPKARPWPPALSTNAPFFLEVTSTRPHASTRGFTEVCSGWHLWPGPGSKLPSSTFPSVSETTPVWLHPQRRRPRPEL